MREMEEREGARQVPLFDPIPNGLQSHEERIRQTYDGTLKRSGITMVLDPLSGSLRRVLLVDLFDGKHVFYEPLVRGRWTSPAGDLVPGSYKYEKLDAVLEDVQKKFREWKATHRSQLPLREWTSLKVSGFKRPFLPGISEENEEEVIEEPKPQVKEPPEKKERSPRRSRVDREVEEIFREKGALGARLRKVFPEKAGVR